MAMNFFISTLSLLTVTLLLFFPSLILIPPLLGRSSLSDGWGAPASPRRVFG